MSEDILLTIMHDWTSRGQRPTRVKANVSLNANLPGYSIRCCVVRLCPLHSLFGVWLLLSDLIRQDSFLQILDIKYI